MDDIEKNRVTYVQQMESKLQYLQGEYEKFKTIADKWEPKVTGVVETATSTVTFGLEFGGKMTRVSVNRESLVNTDLTSATTAVLEAFVDNLVSDQLRPLVAPEVQRALQASKSIEGAGQW